MLTFARVPEGKVETGSTSTSARPTGSKTKGPPPARPRRPARRRRPGRRELGRAGRPGGQRVLRPRGPLPLTAGRTARVRPTPEPPAHDAHASMHTPQPCREPGCPQGAARFRRQGCIPMARIVITGRSSSGLVGSIAPRRSARQKACGSRHTSPRPSRRDQLGKALVEHETPDLDAWDWLKPGLECGGSSRAWLGRWDRLPPGSSASRRLRPANFSLNLTLG